MCDEDLWADTRTGLSKLGFLHFADYGNGTTLSEMADHAVSDAPVHFILIGFSMGGFVAREIALRYPDRVTALVLIGTSARGDSPEKSRRKRDLAQLTRRSVFRGISRLACKSSLHPNRKNDETLLGRIKAMAMRVGKGAFVRQIGLLRHDSHEYLKDVSCVTLVIAAGQDQLRSIVESEELVVGIPDSELVIIEDCGHMVPMEQPDQLVKTIIEWHVR